MVATIEPPLGVLATPGFDGKPAGLTLGGSTTILGLDFSVPASLADLAPESLFPPVVDLSTDLEPASLPLGGLLPGSTPLPTRALSTFLPASFESFPSFGGVFGVVSFFPAFLVV